MEKQKKSVWKITRLCLGLLLILNLSACGVGEDGYNYGNWDADENEMIDRNEFDTNIADRYDEWDANNDNFLDENEFASFNENNDYYGEWDADSDNRLNSDEFHNGLFSEWDGNDDGYLEENEYNENYNTFFGS